MIVITILVSSCLSPKALPNEKKLFVENNKTSFYIISSVPSSFIKPDPHFCILMVSDIKNKKQNLQYYSSIYAAKDTSFTSYHSYSDSLVMDTSYQFPITSIFERNDSSNLVKWNWQWHRNKLKLESNDKKNNFSFKAKFKKQLPFIITQAKQQPTIFCINPISSQSTLDEQTRIKYTSNLFIGLVKDGAQLFKKYVNQYMIWVNLALKNGEMSTQCFVLNAEGKTSSVLESASTLLFHLPTEKTKAYWESKATKKKYPLYWEIKDTRTNYSYQLKPCIVNQELNFKTNSFWMGGIQILNAEGKELMGKGNMYILKL